MNKRRWIKNFIADLVRSHGTGGWQTFDDMMKFGLAVARAENAKCAKMCRELPDKFRVSDGPNTVKISEECAQALEQHARTDLNSD